VHRFQVRGDAVSGIKGEVDNYLRFVKSRQWDVLAMHHAHVWNTDALLPHLNEIGVPAVFVGHGLSGFGAPIYETYYANLANSMRNIQEVALSTLTEEKDFCPRYGLPAPRVIPNGVDPAIWHTPALNLRERWGIGKSPWLLSVSNHTPAKNHAAIFDVIRQVRQQRRDAQGTIIGGHHPAEKWSLGRLGVKGGCWYKCRLASLLGAGVNLRTDVPKPDVVSALKEADLLVMTSNWEAYPLAMLEAMAAGTPWVSFDVGCARENAGGLVVGSAQEMADTVLALLNDPERCRKIGDEGRAQIAAKHDWETIVDQYEELYLSVNSSQPSVRSLQPLS
jgi:glycosyltransferase involved in cell wall biosynthesis